MLAPTVIIQTGCFSQKQNEGQLFRAPNKHSVVNALRLADLKAHGDVVAKPHFGTNFIKRPQSMLRSAQEFHGRGNYSAYMPHHRLKL
jgi:hypothetical protein